MHCWSGYLRSVLTVMRLNFSLLRKLFSAAFALAFFGFFRISELLGQSGNSALQRPPLKVDDVQVSERLTVMLGGSKTDQTQKGTQVVIEKTTNKPAVCPVKLMKAYLEIRQKSSQCLFIHYGGAPLTRYQFQGVLKRAAAMLGWNTSTHTSHSFRIGAATTAALNGLSLECIKAKGRWKSKAAQGYIRPGKI